MNAQEYYIELEEKKPFTRLTSTGITDNLVNVFEFAEAYHKDKVKNLGLFDVSDSVEKMLKPKYMNSEFTWGQIEKAIKKSTDC